MTRAAEMGDRDGDGDSDGLEILGDRKHNIDSVNMDEIAGSSQNLKSPSDLESHPKRENDLWVTNHGENAIVVFKDATSSSIENKRDSGSEASHYLGKPGALAFDANDPGGLITADGKYNRWVKGDLSRVEGFAGHSGFDNSSKFLYIADTGNSRIAFLDATTGKQGEKYSNYDPCVDAYHIDDTKYRRSSTAAKVSR